MTQEQQRIKIAEACGAEWHSVLQTPNTEKLVLSFGQWTNLGPMRWELQDGRVLSHDIPDYTSDLNAMHEAEKILPCGPNSAWRQRLEEVCGTLGNMLRATAAQRAEAFINTLYPGQ